MYLIFLLYIICASMFTISKWGLYFSEPFFYVAVRLILSGFLLLGYSLIFSRKNTIKDLVKNIISDWFLFSQIILFHIYLTYICDLYALKNITSIESSFLYNLSPFISALLSYLFFSELMTPKKWFGLLLGFASLLPGLVSQGIYYQEEFSFSLVPKILTLIAVASSAYGWIILRKLVKYKNYSPVFVNGFGMLFGGFLSLMTSYYFESWAPYPVTDWLPFIQSVILIIIVSNIIFYNLYGYLLNFYTATLLSFAGFLCPIFTAIFGWIFLGESVSIWLFFSFILLIIGIYIFYQEELKQGYIKE